MNERRMQQLTIKEAKNAHFKNIDKVYRDHDFWEKYKENMDQLWKNANINMKPIVGQISSLFRSYLKNECKCDFMKIKILDLGSGKLGNSQKYTGLYDGLVLTDRVCEVDHEGDNMMQLDFTDEEQVIHNAKHVKAVTSFFAAEIYLSAFDFSRLIERLFKETETGAVFTSGIINRTDPSMTVVNDLNLRTFTSNYHITSLMSDPDKYNEVCMDHSAPSEMFGKDWIYRWRLITKK